MDTDTRLVGVGVGEEFTITVEAVSTAGYRWAEEHDPTMVELVSAESRPKGPQVGGATIQEFRLRAVAPGETTVLLRYKRPWETEARETLTYQVQVI